MGHITPREKQMLQILVQQGTMVRVAQVLGVSRQTVKNAMTDARNRTGFSTYELVYWLGKGMFDD